MIILQESNTSQTFKCIPRYYEADTVTLRNETTGEELEYNVTSVQTDYFLEVTATFDVKENTFYTIKVFDGLEIVYRDRVFCTNQTISDYSVNDNEYITYQSDNDFIIIS